MIFRRWQDTKTARAVFWVAAAFAFLMAILPHPPHVPFSPSDKVQHIIAFATLGLLAAWAYSAMPVVQLIVRLSLFGAAIEVVQAIPVLHRDSDALDWLADTFAAGLALLLVVWLRDRASAQR